MAIRASDPVRSLKIGSKTPRRGVSQSEADKPSSSFSLTSSRAPQTNLSSQFFHGHYSSSSFVGGIGAGSSSSYLLNSSVATASLSSRTFSLRDNLPVSTQVYDFFEIRVATNNFLAKRHSSSSSSSSQSWRCVILNGKDVIVFQRKLRKSTMSAAVMQKLSVISK